MSMPRGLTDLVGTEIRARLDTGLKALAWGTAVAVCLVMGLGLVLASALMALAMLVGPTLAAGILGLGLLFAAALVATVDRRRKLLHPTQKPESAPPVIAPIVIAPQTAPSYLGFLLGFVATRAILRQANQQRSP